MTNARGRGLMATESMGLSSPREAELVLVREPINEGEVELDEWSLDALLAGEYAEGDANVDQLIAVVHTLDGISQQMQLANDQGSLSEHTAAALQTAVESMCSAVGLGKPVVFCLENYGGLSARRQATRVALESIASVINAAIDKILKWLKIVMKFIREVVQELAQGANIIAKRARAVKDRAKLIAHANLDKSKSTIGSSNLTRYFSTGGAVIGPDALTKVYKDYTVLMGKNYTAYIAQTAKNVKLTLQAAEKGDTHQQAMVKIDTLIKTLKTHLFSKFVALTNGTSNEVLGYDLPFGQKSLMVSLIKSEGYYTGMNVLVSDVKSAPKTKGKLATLNYAQIMEVAGAVEHEMLFGLFKDYDKTLSDLNGIDKDVNRGCEKITHLQQKGDGARSVPYSVHFLKDMVASVIDMTAVVHRYDISLARNALEYCTLSIKAHR